MSPSRLRPLTALPPTALLTLFLLPANKLWAESVEIKLRNGDTLHGELVRDESTSELTVIEHPQLGRLEISTQERMPKTPPALWKSSLSAGIVGNKKDGDQSLSVSVSGDSTYKDDEQTLAVRGSFNTIRSTVGNEPAQISTQKGEAGIRYDRSINSRIDLFALSNLQYNELNDSGINTLLGNVGIAFPLIRNEKSVLKLSFGPSLQWSGGGKDCRSDPQCDRTYAASTLTTDLNWTPSKTFRFSLQNQFSTVWASQVLPANTFTAEIRFYPTIHSGLFTSLKYQSIYQSITSPESNNTVTAQIGADF